MLTIREPMRLQSISALRTYPDILGEKIAANYQLTGTEITGADLLHMAVQGAEQYVNTEHGGILSVETHMHADNRIKLELVNQLVNRLMICFTPEFTYQDEVFVASVLQKMGIMNVSGFMQQVHRHMKRNELLNELLNHYYSYGRNRSDIVESFRDHIHHIYKSALKEAYDKECRSVLYLHSQIFERLRTAACNNIIYSYNCQTDRGKTAAQGIREAAWIEQADAIQLSQVREILFHQTNPAVWQEDMYYEIRRFEQGEVTEKAVVQRIAAAVLENVVQKIHRGRQQYRDRRRSEWRDYTRIFYQSAEDVLERFWYFQNEKNVDVRQSQTYAQCMAELIRDEQVLVQLLAETGSFGKAEDLVLSIWENQNIQKQLAAKMRMEERLTDLILGQGAALADEAGYREELRAVQTVYQILRQEKENRRGRQSQKPARGQDGQEALQRQGAEDTQLQIQIQEVEPGRDVTWQQGEREWIPLSRRQEEGHVRDILQLREMQTQRDILQAQEMQEQQNDSGMVDSQYLSYQRDSAYDYMSEFLSRYEEFVSDRKVPLTENVRLLEQVNQHNVSMKQLLDSGEKTEPGKSGNAAKRITVDQAKARQSALRAMENPQEVLREIYENAPAIREELPQEIERILRVTDERTQLFYRRLLGYPPGETDHTAAVSADDSGAEADADGKKHDIAQADRIHSRHMAETKEAAYQIHQHKETEITQLQNHIDAVLRQIEQREDRICQEYVDFEVIFSSADEKMIRNTAEMQNLESIANEKDIEKLESAERQQFIQNKQGTERKEPAENRQLIQSRKDTERKEPVEYPEFKADKGNIGSIENIENIGNRMGIEPPRFHGIDFVHKPEAQMSESSSSPENSLSAKADQILRTEIRTEIQTELKQLRQEQIRQEQVTQQQLQDIKRKLVSESEEQLARLLNRKLRTQVHEISDIVYRDLERRLKNEQRRRGY